MFDTLWRLGVYRTEAELKAGERDLFTDGYFEFTEEEAKEKGLQWSSPAEAAAENNGDRFDIT